MKKVRKEEDRSEKWSCKVKVCSVQLCTDVAIAESAVVVVDV